MITLEQLKIFLWISLTDTSQDVLLQSLIDEMTSYIEKYTWRIFLPQDYIEIKNWHWERIIYIKNYPLNSITSIKIRENSDYSLWFTKTISPNEYTFNKDWEIYFNYNLPRWFNYIQVNYNWWYTTIPQDLQYWLKRLCESVYRQAKQQWIMSESVDWTSIKFTDYSKNNWFNMSIFDNYKSYGI